MAVIGFAAPRIRREGTATQSKEQGSIREYRREFIVHTNNRYDGPLVVLSAPGLPQLYFPYVTLEEQDDFALCTRVHASPLSDKSPFTWLVEADYSTDHQDEKNNENPENPLAEPAEVSFDFETKSVVVTRALDPDASSAQTSMNPKFMDPNNVKGQAPDPLELTKGIVNSAGEPFDPPPEMEDSIPTLTISRNEAFFNPMLATAFKGAVNSDDFLGAKPRQACIKGISASRQQKGSFRFWKVNYVIAFNRETWDLQLLDHGTYSFSPKKTEEVARIDVNAVKAATEAANANVDDASKARAVQAAVEDAETANQRIDAGLKANGDALDETGGDLVPFLDADGNRIVGLLDGKSGALAKGKPAVFLSFRVRAELPFSILQLPQAIRA